MAILAHWLVEDHGFAGTTYTCSNCGEPFNDLFHRVYEFDKCPKCEALIIGEIERRERPAVDVAKVMAMRTNKPRFEHVTQCIDCGYYHVKTLTCNRPMEDVVSRNPDDYCSRAVRKKEE